MLSSSTVSSSISEYQNLNNYLISTIYRYESFDKPIKSVAVFSIASKCFTRIQLLLFRKTHVLQTWNRSTQPDINTSFSCDLLNVRIEKML